MSIKTEPFDAAKYLKTDEDIRAFLEGALADNDPAFITHAIGIVARAKGMTALARETGLTREGLYKSFGPNGNPEFATVLRVINALGLRLHVDQAR